MLMAVLDGLADLLPNIFLILTVSALSCPILNTCGETGRLAGRDMLSGCLSIFAICIPGLLGL